MDQGASRLTGGIRVFYYDCHIFFCFFVPSTISMGRILGGCINILHFYQTSNKTCYKKILSTAFPLGLCSLCVSCRPCPTRICERSDESEHIGIASIRPITRGRLVAPKLGLEIGGGIPRGTSHQAGRCFVPYSATRVVCDGQKWHILCALSLQLIPSSPFQLSLASFFFLILILLRLCHVSNRNTFDSGRSLST